MRVEGYGPAAVRDEFAASRAAAGQPPAPAIAVVSGSLDVDFDGPLYAGAVVPTITVTVADAPPARLERARAAGEVLIAGESGHVDLATAADALARGGRRRLLCEGGPKLLAAAVAAGCVDELCLSISPQLRAGGGLRILDGPAPRGARRPGVARAAHPGRLPLRTLSGLEPRPAALVDAAGPSR